MTLLRNGEVMRARVLPWQSLNLPALAAAAWRWWLAELSGLLPRRLLDLANARRSRVFVAITPEILVVSHQRGGSDVELLRLPLDTLASGAGPGDAAGFRDTLAAAQTTLRFPRSEALRKTIELPLSAARNLRKILSFELERQSPIEPERIYFDHRIVRRDKAANKLVVELRIVKREAIDAAVSACRALGLAPASLEFAGDEHAFELVTVAGRLARGGRRRRRFTLALAALACALAAALASVEWARDREEAAEIAARLARAKAEAQATEALRKDIEALTVKTEFLAREKAKPLAVKLASEITRLLPDGTWLFQLEMHGASIHLRGYSPAASQLIAVFDGSPLFTNTRFQAPVTQGPRSGLERFDLSFDLRGDKP
jgi:general secretion pathway protein L